MHGFRAQPSIFYGILISVQLLIKSARTKSTNNWIYLKSWNQIKLDINSIVEYFLIIVNLAREMAGKMSGSAQVVRVCVCVCLC